MEEKLEKKIFNFKDENDFYTSLPYYELKKEINGEIFRKHFIFDIRNMKDKEIHCIFDDFVKFNDQLLMDQFFAKADEGKFDYRKNSDVLFLYSKDGKYPIDQSVPLHNFEFAFKKFVTEDELADIVSNSSVEFGHDKQVFSFENGEIVVPGFNLIYGLNGSGKSTFLKEVAAYFDLLIFNVNYRGLDLKKYINDFSLVEKYLQKLDQMNIYSENSRIRNHFYRLSQILAFCQERKKMVLLDDLSWGSLDERNQINVLDALFDYSCDNNSAIVVTSCHESVKRLVKNRVYDPNFIELSTRG